MDVTKVILGTTLALVMALLATWAIQGNDFFLYREFAPKYEQVRRQTFEQTKSYNQGMIQQLQGMQFEYIKADDAHKTALASVILHIAADYPEESLSPDLRQFIQQLKREKMMAR